MWLARILTRPDPEAEQRRQRYQKAKELGLYSTCCELTLNELKKLEEDLGAEGKVTSGPGKEWALGRPRSEFYRTLSSSQQQQQMAKVRQQADQLLAENED